MVLLKIKKNPKQQYVFVFHVKLRKISVQIAFVYKM